ncbi:Hypothetical protein SMAX5B_014869 [Scophthalmus maximus]|uniref:Uncharacterized protein n=1 Tax=Scophthalmus maximus TaxID=52904 RepID=A0A2U9C0L4_SCOMX|nr:Hypothetical protein SMAX5B_014869 [Scophthalmus maximus]
MLNLERVGVRSHIECSCPSGLTVCFGSAGSRRLSLDSGASGFSRGTAERERYLVAPPESRRGQGVSTGDYIS